MRRIVLLLMGLALAGCDRQKASDQQGGGAPAAAPQMPVKAIDRSHAGEPLPDIVVKDGNGEDTALSEFKGSPVLVNLWASWCAPCVKELPTLNRLASKPGAPQIVALSQDNGPIGSVAAFLGGHGIDKLDTYQDSDMAFSAKSGAAVLPTTLLYDQDGREVWRFVGDRDWMSAEATADLAAVSPAAIR